MSPNILAKYNGETLVYYFDWTSRLRKNSDGSLAETISSVTTFAEMVTSVLTISDKAVNTDEIQRDEPDVSLVPYDKAIAIGAAAQAEVAGGTAGNSYVVHIVVATTDSRVLEDYARLQIKPVPTA
jgi:translation elongation factor EF-1alpha